MKAFDLLQPRSAAEAIRALPGAWSAQGARPLAGGQDLITEMKAHLVEPELLVDLRRVSEAAPGLAWAPDGALRIGALTTVAQLEEDASLRERHALLAHAARSIGSPQIRTQATVGGNLCQRPRCWYYRHEGAHCLKKGGSECFSYAGMNKYNAILGGGPSWIVHPSDLAPALVALGASVEIASAGAGVLTSSRALPLADFFTRPDTGDPTRENVLAPSELLLGVDVPAPEPGTRSCYLKFKERGSFDWALSSVALVLGFDGKRVRRARLVLGGVAPLPWRCEAAEALLVGQEIEAALCARVAEAALSGAQPLSQNGYKVPLTKALVVRALRQLADVSAEAPR